MADELAHLSVYTMAISDDERDGIVFLHRVTPGCAGRSYGVHVARLAGMPLSIVQRAEMVLQQLESRSTGENVIFTAIVGTDSDRRVAEANGQYTPGDWPLSPQRTYEWQSDEARLAALALEQLDGTDAELEAIDVCAITPLDALNLLFLLQKKRTRLRR
jgi:DNA mismatch repair protein MutS